MRRITSAATSCFAPSPADDLAADPPTVDSEPPPLAGKVSGRRTLSHRSLDSSWLRQLRGAKEAGSPTEAGSGPSTPRATLDTARRSAEAVRSPFDATDPYDSASSAAFAPAAKRLPGILKAPQASQQHILGSRPSDRSTSTTEATGRCNGSTHAAAGGSALSGNDQAAQSRSLQDVEQAGQGAELQHRKSSLPSLWHRPLPSHEKLNELLAANNVAQQAHTSAAETDKPPVECWSNMVTIPDLDVGAAEEQKPDAADDWGSPGGLLSDGTDEPVPADFMQTQDLEEGPAMEAARAQAISARLPPAYRAALDSNTSQQAAKAALLRQLQARLGSQRS